MIKTVPPGPWLSGGVGHFLKQRRHTLRQRNMSSVASVDAATYLEPKTEDSAEYEGLQDIDMDKPLKEDSPASQLEEEEPEAETTSQADEEMEDLFGDDKEVDEVKHEG